MWNDKIIWNNNMSNMSNELLSELLSPCKVLFKSLFYVRDTGTPLQQHCVLFLCELQSVSPDHLFQFSQLLFNFYVTFFLDHFIITPNIPNNLVTFFVYFRSLTIWHVIKYKNDRSHLTITATQKWYYLSNGPSPKIHKQIPPHFKGWWGGNENMIKK